jgi:DNA polymerase III delta prime subunit
MSESAQLLSELLRPQQLGDLTLSQRVIDRLQRMLDSRTTMNMLFYGRPGIGKTSAARVFAASDLYSLMEINGSSETGVDFVRVKISRFGSSMGWNLRTGESACKICFIDEADYLSKSAQAALRKVIEDLSFNCRFILAVNDISKLIPAIRSRLMEICFDIAPADRPEVQRRLIERYEIKLSEHGIRYDKERLRQIVGIHYPDLRSIANHLEFEFA